MINTVRGKIETGNIKRVVPHEHVACVSNDMLQSFGEKWLDKSYLADYAARVLKGMKERFAVDLYVDGTSWDLGRDIRLLKEVSEKADMHIVASSGLYYFKSMLTMARSAEEIAELIITECKNGIEGTDIFPGILKCATEDATVDKDNKKRIEAVAIAQRETGLPVYSHLRHKGESAFEQIEIFKEKGADLNRVIFGHITSRFNEEYLERVLETGVTISLDQWFYENSKEECTKIVSNLVRKGYADKIIFSLDHCIYSDFGTNATTGLQLDEKDHTDCYSFLFENLVSQFRDAGICETYIEKMFGLNMLRVLNNN